jgi:hypothetical protein
MLSAHGLGPGMVPLQKATSNQSPAVPLPETSNQTPIGLTQIAGRGGPEAQRRGRIETAGQSRVPPTGVDTASGLLDQQIFSQLRNSYFIICAAVVLTVANKRKVEKE